MNKHLRNTDLRPTGRGALDVASRTETVHAKTVTEWARAARSDSPRHGPPSVLRAIVHRAD